MRKHSTQTESLSTPKWEMLEAWTRAKIQEGLQAVLEEELTELLGRVKSARRAAVDAPPGYRPRDPTAYRASPGHWPALDRRDLPTISFRPDVAPRW